MQPANMFPPEPTLRASTAASLRGFDLMVTPWQTWQASHEQIKSSAIDTEAFCVIEAATKACKSPIDAHRSCILR